MAQIYKHCITVSGESLHAARRKLEAWTLQNWDETVSVSETDDRGGDECWEFVSRGTAMPRLFAISKEYSLRMLCEVLDLSGETGDIVAIDDGLWSGVLRRRWLFEDQPSDGSPPTIAKWERPIGRVWDDLLAGCGRSEDIWPILATKVFETSTQA